MVAARWRFVLGVGCLGVGCLRVTVVYGTLAEAEWAVYDISRLATPTLRCAQGWSCRCLAVQHAPQTHTFVHGLTHPCTRTHACKPTEWAHFNARRISSKAASASKLQARDPQSTGGDPLGELSRNLLYAYRCMRLVLCGFACHNVDTSWAATFSPCVVPAQRNAPSSS